MASVTIASGEREGTRINLPDNDLVVGRSGSCDVQLVGEAISGRHLRFVRRGQRYAIKDLDSTNGTLLNGRSVSEGFLKHHDRITLGDVDLVFEDDTSGEERLAESAVFATRRSSRWKAVIVIIVIAALTLVAAVVFVQRLRN